MSTISVIKFSTVSKLIWPRWIYMYLIITVNVPFNSTTWLHLLTYAFIFFKSIKRGKQTEKNIYVNIDSLTHRFSLIISQCLLTNGKRTSSFCSIAPLCGQLKTFQISCANRTNELHDLKSIKNYVLLFIIG